jgi:hypothetical protein
MCQLAKNRFDCSTVGSAEIIQIDVIGRNHPNRKPACPAHPTIIGANGCYFLEEQPGIVRMPTTARADALAQDPEITSFRSGQTATHVDCLILGHALLTSVAKSSKCISNYLYRKQMRV